jgi:hypothetical protein
LVLYSLLILAFPLSLRIFAALSLSDVRAHRAHSAKAITIVEAACFVASKNRIVAAGCVPSLVKKMQIAQKICSVNTKNAFTVVTTTKIAHPV